MNDIAAASEKGRRTIYTYFKNKREILNAVVEKQSESIIEHLRATAQSDLMPEEKLRKYLMDRYELVAEYSPRHDKVLRRLFDRDLKRMERVHKIAVQKEAEVFMGLLNEGIEKGVFDSNQAMRLVKLHPILFQGVDFCVMRDGANTPDSVMESREDVISFIVNGILKQN